MTRVDRVHAELEELDGLVAMFAAAEPPVWSGEWLTLQSLLRRQVDLTHELDLLASQTDLRLTLSGGAEHQHWLDAGFMGALLTHLQGTVAAVTQAVTLGDLLELQARGPLPRSVADSATLSVGAMRAGSFVITLNGPPDRITQVTMESVLAGEEPQPAFDQAVLRIMDVLDAPATISGPRTLSEVLADIGSDRALNRLRELVGDLAGSDTSVTIVRRDPFGGPPREVHVTAIHARQIRDALEVAELTTETITRNGTLSGVRWRFGRFDLDMRDDDGVETTITGHVATELRDVIRPWFDHYVRAHIEVTTTKLAAERERTSFRLVGVDPLE